MNSMFYEKINSDKVKELTLAKIRGCSGESGLIKPKKKKLLLAAAITALLILGTVGSARLFDWKYLVNGEVQQGDFGGKVSIGEGYADMEPGAPGDTADENEVYRFDAPTQILKEGQLRLFGTCSVDKDWFSFANDIAANTSTDLSEIRDLCENAEVKICLPEAVTEDFTVKSSYTRFYAKEEQIPESKLIYSLFGSKNEEMLFQLPEGYDKNIRGTHIEFITPSGDELLFTSHLATSSVQAYGGSGSAIIEQLDLEGFSEAVYVYDYGTADLYCWKETPAVNTVELEAFGRGKLPEGSLLEKRGSVPAETYSWQSYCVSSKDMSRDELIEIMKSINISG